MDGSSDEGTVRSVRRLLVGAVGVSTALAVALWTPGHTFDFGLDWLTAKALISGVDPHQPLHVLGDRFGVAIEHGGLWAHPRTPAALLMQAPVGWLPLEYGYQVGRVLTVLSFAGLMWVLSRLSGLRIEWLLLAMPALLFVWPFSVVLDFSQTSFLVAAGIGLSWYLAQDDRWLAGVPLAVAVAFKLWPWLVVPALWLSGYRKTAVGAVVSFAGLNLAGLMFPNVTLGGTVEAMSQATTFDTWSLGLPLWAVSAGGLALLVALSRVTDHLVAWSIPLALAVAPVLWAHYLVTLLVPAAELLRLRRNEAFVCVVPHPVDGGDQSPIGWNVRQEPDPPGSAHARHN